MFVLIALIIVLRQLLYFIALKRPRLTLIALFAFCLRIRIVNNILSFWEKDVYDFPLGIYCWRRYCFCKFIFLIFSSIHFLYISCFLVLVWLGFQCFSILIMALFWFISIFLTRFLDRFLSLVFVLFDFCAHRFVPFSFSYDLFRLLLKDN